MISRARPAGSWIGSPWPGSAIRGASSIVRCKRREVVAERVRPCLGIEPDGRRDRAEQVVAGDQHAVALEADVAVRVAGELEHAPAVDLVAFAEQLRVAREADEGRERMALAAAARPRSAAGSPCRRN